MRHARGLETLARDGEGLHVVVRAHHYERMSVEVRTAQRVARHDLIDAFEPHAVPAAHVRDETRLLGDGLTVEDLADDRIGVLEVTPVSHPAREHVEGALDMRLFLPAFAVSDVLHRIEQELGELAEQRQVGEGEAIMQREFAGHPTFFGKAPSASVAPHPAEVPQESERNEQAIPHHPIRGEAKFAMGQETALLQGDHQGSGQHAVQMRADGLERVAGEPVTLRALVDQLGVAFEGGGDHFTLDHTGLDHTGMDHTGLAKEVTGEGNAGIDEGRGLPVHVEGGRGVPPARCHGEHHGVARRFTLAFEPALERKAAQRHVQITGPRRTGAQDLVHRDTPLAQQ